jgi:putative ABC transport system ATP-binding protein
VLEARGIRYVREGQAILDGVDVTVPAGGSLAVVGPSGSGKTSLLAILSGLAPPSAGEVYVDGERRTGSRAPWAGVSMVLQGYGLVSLLTAAENIEIAVRAAGVPAREAQTVAAAALDDLGLGPHAGQIVEELSGGQQQRVAVARALARQPRLLIADEPTAELDQAARAVVLNRMLEVASRGGSVVLATHDIEVAERCDQVLDLRVAVGLDPVRGMAAS